MLTRVPMADQDAPGARSTSSPSRTDASIGDTIETVKAYVKQETMEPLRGAGRWLAVGAAASILIGIGALLLILGGLRLLQHEFAPTFRGRWMSLLPYVITFVASLAVIGLAISRIGKKSLNSDRK